MRSLNLMHVMSSKTISKRHAERHVSACSNRLVISYLRDLVALFPCERNETLRFTSGLN